MVVLVASDIHSDVKMLMYRLSDSNIQACICAGDLTVGFTEETKIPKPIYAVYGNNENWDIYKKKVDNLVWMSAGKVYDVCGFKVAGMGGVMSKTPQDPRHYSPAEVEASLSLEPNSLDIFVTHHPPKSYADYRVDLQRHCGSPDVLEILSYLQPKLFVSGHLHWEQVDIYGNGGGVSTYIITLGRFKHGDYGLLSKSKLKLFKKGVHCFDIFWQNRTD